MKEKKKTNNYFFYDFVKITAALPGLLWFRPKRLYESKKAKEKIRGGALLIANHSGNFDPISLMYGIWYRRHHFVATSELFDTKAKRFWFEQFHCIEIDKDNVSMNSFREIVDHLRRDKIVSMYPEGEVTRNEDVQKFKSGVVLMAVTAKKPIVPVYVKKRKNLFERQRVVIGEPINPSELFGKMPSLTDMEKITELLREKERQLKEIADKD
jgi:1-acyl-sn-glycerol-3-phosphate acyltransferase